MCAATLTLLSGLEQCKMGIIKPGTFVNIAPCMSVHHKIRVLSIYRQSMIMYQHVFLILYTVLFWCDK